MASRLNLGRINAMEGDEENTPLLPKHKALLIKLIFFLEDQPENLIEDYDADTMEDTVQSLCDDMTNRLVKD